jgi:hypothetical protein
MNHPSKQLLSLLVPLTLFAFGSAFGCGSDEAEPEIVVTERIGEAGGTLRLESEDGSSFEIRIPAGALSEEQEISIRRLPAASWPPELQDNPPIGDAVFELLPEGTVFSTPVTTVTRFAQAPAGLIEGTNQTLPSHASRSTAGTMERHPTAVTSRTDGSVVMVGRTTHFSVHWLSTQTGQGEFGVNLQWPIGPYWVESYIEPEAFTVWTSSEASPFLTVTVGVFAELLAGEISSLYPGWFMVGDYAADTPVETALLEFLDDLGDTRMVSSTDGTMVSLEVSYPVGEPFVFGVDYLPTFMCPMEGSGTGWVVVITEVSDGGTGTVPLTYVNEVTFECTLPL